MRLEGKVALITGAGAVLEGLQNKARIGRNGVQDDADLFFSSFKEQVGENERRATLIKEWLFFLPVEKVGLRFDCP